LKNLLGARVDKPTTNSACEATVIEHALRGGRFALNLKVSLINHAIGFSTFTYRIDVCYNSNIARASNCRCRRCILLSGSIMACRESDDSQGLMADCDCLMIVGPDEASPARPSDNHFLALQQRMKPCMRLDSADTLSHKRSNLKMRD
jgi:hypothetical protein